MDVESISSWILQPDVCRCCLSGTGTWDLTTAYITDSGGKEVFANILQDCFGVSLSCMNEMDVSRLVCDLCVKQLRGASSFHQQVVRADERFSHYWTTRKDYSTNPQSKSYKKKTQKIRQKNNVKAKKWEQKEIDGEYDCDSDTPIARLRGSSVMKEDFVDNDYLPEEVKENRLQGYEHEVEIDLTGQSEIRLKKSTKQVSERKRIILTCSIVLIETTACPFRHHKSWFRCFFCTQDFMDINSLKSHYTQSHLDVEAELKKMKRYPRSLQIEISNLECRHCGTNLTDVDKMIQHFFENHDKTVYKECIADYKVNSSPYMCHLCEKEFHVFRTLTTHLNEHYTNCICDICGKSFMNSKRLKVHKRTHELGTYPCKSCGKVLKTKISQSNHMESAHSKRIIKCQICLKPMKHYNDRIKHMSIAHNITHTFKCPFCDREYNIKHYLSTHIRQTHGHKNKKCKVCNMAFITNHSLKKHMLKHTGERAFTCSFCCKSYARSYTLKEHMRAHENDKRLTQ
ncbi:zinc finger protein 502-like [Maniola hyperantus]|uniref:zinc finger protein 502-like n=1 Tax=Aphantopus hyperantus TaxID=2795564 RepID=UPI001568BFA9|nr:zinc finger protein 287-like [Maniola hyperantus]